MNPAQPTRILFHITQFLHGGIEASLLSLINALQQEAPQLEIGLSITYPTAAWEEHFKTRIPTAVVVHLLAPEAWFRNSSTFILLDIFRLSLVSTRNPSLYSPLCGHTHLQLP